MAQACFSVKSLKDTEGRVRAHLPGPLAAALWAIIEQEMTWQDQAPVSCACIRTLPPAAAPQRTAPGWPIQLLAQGRPRVSL
jgi:hypothetical protein